MFNVELAADLLSVTKQTILDWVASGKLKSSCTDNDGETCFDWSAFSGFPEIADMDPKEWEAQSRVKPHRKYSKCNHKAQ